MVNTALSAKTNAATVQHNKGIYMVFMNEYVEQLLEKWGVENVFYGTGNPDEPRLTNSCELPFCWKQNNNGSKKILEKSMILSNLL